MADDTYYSILQIPETATATEIRSAYLRLIREVHPDRLANAPEYWRLQAEEKTKEVNEAYGSLSDSAKRRLYDEQLASYRVAQSRTQSTDSRGSKQRARPRSATSAQAPKNPSHITIPSLTTTDRIVVATFGVMFGACSTSVYWWSSENTIILTAFLLATLSFFVAICLYQRTISRVLAMAKITRHQLWVVLGVILIFLLIGRAVFEVDPGQKSHAQKAVP